MTLNENEQRFFIWCGLALVGVIVYLFKEFVGYVKQIASSVQKMEKDLAVLTKDHTNLKDVVEDHEARIRKFESS